jgi:sugar lactone lactonase YvrE
MTPLTILGDVRDGVGESPVWDSGQSCLWSVDITGRRILRRWPNGTTEAWSTDDLPTAISLREDGKGAMVSFARGVASWSVEHGTGPTIVTPEADPLMRLNEGRCDPTGQFWCTSMETNLNSDLTAREQDSARGRLFRIEGQKVIELLGPEFVIPNTMAWSPDCQHFYLGDSGRNTIWIWDYDKCANQIKNRRIFVEGGPGVPDGSAMDSEGCLWTARFGAGRLIRYDPTGAVEREIILPVVNPTACTFGGHDLRTLYITSARFGLSKPSSLDGATLILETNIAGQAENFFEVCRA